MHRSRVTHIVTGPCGCLRRVMCLMHANHTTHRLRTRLLHQILGQYLVHFLVASWPCALACAQPEHNYGTTTGWVRVVVT